MDPWRPIAIRLSRTERDSPNKLFHTMRSIPIIVAFSLLVSGCASSTAVLQEPPTAVASTPISLREAFKAAETSQSAKGKKIPVFSSQAPLVSMSEKNLLAIPLINDGSKLQIVKIKSYVTRKNDGSYVLFYPLLSFVDQNFQTYLTVKPKYEMAYKQNILTNEFEVPVGVERMLIHTTQEYFGKGLYEGAVTSGASDGAYGVAGAMGGVVGALILQAATQNEGKQFFKFGEVGVISIEID